MSAAGGYRLLFCFIWKLLGAASVLSMGGGDTGGKYIKTVVTHEQGYKSNVLDTKDGFRRTEELHEPSTILIPDEDAENFRGDQLSSDELGQLKKHVQSFMKLVD
ncbi:hypothetical protein [Paenibacillus sp. ATY16]|uniref:hypothetical protein n=1 Tax=Paenibacillus sp. ATY16 TaxID=1759312 RepID=UPI00200C94AF|nr:hypothetical protein [Paenibacillus sp. ATY16]